MKEEDAADAFSFVVSFFDCSNDPEYVCNNDKEVTESLLFCDSSSMSVTALDFPERLSAFLIVPLVAFQMSFSVLLVHKLYCSAASVFFWRLRALWLHGCRDDETMWFGVTHDSKSDVV